MSAPKILVVEDETSISNLVVSYLRKEGYEVFAAADGPSGLKAARAVKPDLIVLDSMLPGTQPPAPQGAGGLSASRVALPASSQGPATRSDRRSASRRAKGRLVALNPRRLHPLIMLTRILRP